jgi:uncharacterized protein (DUF2147 family)
LRLKCDGGSFMHRSWIVGFLLLLCGSLAAEDITGFWQTMDKKTNKPSSVIAFYLYEGKMYGKIIATCDKNGEVDDTIYHPTDRAPGLADKPFYCGLDIVWDGKTTDGGKKYKGYIVNPRKGDVYNAEIWKKGENLIIRGKVLMFGKNITFPPFPEDKFTPEFKKPDLSTFVPNVPKT